MEVIRNVLVLERSFIILNKTKLLFSFFHPVGKYVFEMFQFFIYHLIAHWLITLQPYSIIDSKVGEI